jgi:hypothetical protein
MRTTYDPVTDSYLSANGTTFHPRIHQIRNTRLAGVVSRMGNRKDVFTYRHARTGNWVLAQWIRKPRRCGEPGLMHEVEVFEGNPDEGFGPNPDLMGNLFRNMRTTASRRIRKIVERRRLRESLLRGIQDEKKRLGKWLRKQTGWTQDDVNLTLSSMKVESFTDRDRVRDTARDLLSRAAGRVISVPKLILP